METRLTLFDLINVLLPGILILFFFSRCCCGSDITITVDNSYVILPFAYLVGLVYHKLLDRIFRGLRNNLILVSYCHFRESNKKMPKRVLWYSIQCNVNKNGFWRKINDVFFCLINCWCFIFSNGDKEYTQEPVGDNDLKLKETKEKYIYSYYYLQKNNMLGNVPILEAQLTFVRNISILAILFVFFWGSGSLSCNELNRYADKKESCNIKLNVIPDRIHGKLDITGIVEKNVSSTLDCEHNESDCSLSLFTKISGISLIIFIVALVWLLIQLKIFRLVWEGYYNLSEIDNSERMEKVTNSKK